MSDYIVKIKDTKGYRRKYIVPIGVNEQDLHKCIPLDPPPLDGLDWEAIQRDLHNQLSNRNINYLEDIKGDGNFNAAILSAIKPHLIHLYKELNK